MAWPRKLQIAQADPSVIPSVVKAAQCEMALYLLATDPTTAPKTAGYKVMQADTLRLEIDKADRPEMIPAHVAAMLEEETRKEATPELISPQEFADKTGVHPATVRKWIREGTIKGKKIGSRKWFIPVTELEKALKV